MHDAESTPMQYAWEIRRECDENHASSSFVLIGTSFGGYMARRTAIACHASGSPPCGLVVLDPPPLMALSKMGCDWEPCSMRQAAIGFLSVQMATVAEMTEREDAMEQAQASLDAKAAAWPAEEIAFHAAKRLMEAGVRPAHVDVDEAMSTGRRIHAFAQSVDLVQAEHSRHPDGLPAEPCWDTFLMVCPQRVAFFANGGTSMQVSNSMTSDTHMPAGV